jgi:hypothetical protein
MPSRWIYVTLAVLIRSSACAREISPRIKRIEDEIKTKKTAKKLTLLSPFACLNDV